MSRRVLVTGATGYIGGRLVPELLAAGHEIRCLARTPDKLADRDWHDEVEVVEADVLEPSSLADALDGVDAAYYLIHSMDGEKDFGSRDRQAAENFRDAAAAAGVGQIVYLGGLGHLTEEDEKLSRHLSSRHQVGEVLADGPVPVTELRAAIIIGSGSASFEMLRNLVEVLPVMVTPRWVDTRCQPIAIRDVLYYLVNVIETEEAKDRILEIGGPDVMTYRELMQSYAGIAGLRHRQIVTVPVLTPKLSSHWVGLVTPLPTGLAKPLVESLTTEVVVRDDAITRILPRDTVPFTRAVELALQRIQDLEVSTTWASAELARSRRAGTHDATAEPSATDPSWAGGTVLTDERTMRCEAPPEQLFATVMGIGGEQGYFSSNLLWSVRGILDALIGGIGMRRGRRHPSDLRAGEALDFWRVDEIVPGEMLRLRAEMKVPGDAWLEFRVRPDGEHSILEQRARFAPRGLWGRVYWHSLWPFHLLVFPRMAARIAVAAEHEAARNAIPAGSRERADEVTGR